MNRGELPNGIEPVVEAKPLEERAAEVRMRLMHAMDALGQKRHELTVVSGRFMKQGPRVAVVAGIAAVAVASLVAGVVAYAAAVRARRRATARVVGLLPWFQWRRPAPPPPEEPSILSRLAMRLVMGLASAAVRTAVHKLAEGCAKTTQAEADGDLQAEPTGAVGMNRSSNGLEERKGEEDRTWPR